MMTTTTSFSTMQTGCLTGGVKRSSGANVLGNVAENWSKVRDDGLPNTNWMICGFSQGSKMDVTTLFVGGGGVEALSKALQPEVPAYGGFLLKTNGRFVTFFHVGNASTPALLKGRVCLFKQAVFNVFQGSDCEVTVEPSVTTEHDIMMQFIDKFPSTKHNTSNIKRPTNEIETKNRLVQTKPIITAASSTATHHNYQHLKSSYNTDTTVIPPVATTTTTTSANTPTNLYPYERLKNITDSTPLPPGVDPFHRELSLSPQEFKKLFGMDSPTFLKLPKWKQTQFKKKTQLF